MLFAIMGNMKKYIISLVILLGLFVTGSVSAYSLYSNYNSFGVSKNVRSVRIAPLPTYRSAYVPVSSYFKSSGTYVNSYYRTWPDNNVYNNFSYLKLYRYWGY